jgi:hypothetical protein
MSQGQITQPPSVRFRQLVTQKLVPGAELDNANSDVLLSVEENERLEIFASCKQVF